MRIFGGGFHLFTAEGLFILLVIPLLVNGLWSLATENEESGNADAVDDFFSDFGQQQSWEQYDYDDSSQLDKTSAEEKKRSEFRSMEIDQFGDTVKQLQQRGEFIEANLVSRWKAAVFLDRICTPSSMTVALRRGLFVSADSKDPGSIIVLRSCCLDHRLQVNRTHLIFNFSFDDFAKPTNASDKMSEGNGGCCSELNALHYEVGVAYVFEFSAYVFSTNTFQDIDGLIAYCYFDDPKHNEDTMVQTGIRFYSSLYDRVAYSATTKHIGFNEDIIFEIVDEEGPLAMENMPLNCWLSPQPNFADSLDDKEETLFVENGCPARKGVILDRKTDQRMKSDMGTRVRFSLGTFYRQEKKFLFVHCQYVKCSNASGAAGRNGELPPCPWSHSCAFNQPVTYNENQLSGATSYAILVTGRNKVQEVHLPSAGIADNSGSFNPHDCKRPANVDGSDDDGQGKISIGTAALYCFAAFFMGVALVVTIWFCERRYREGKPAIRFDEQLDKNSKAIRLPMLDPLKQSQVSPRARMHAPATAAPSGVARNCAPRQHHLSGHDGFEPGRPAASFNPSLSTIVSSSIILRNDEEWNMKQISDSID